MDDRRRAMRRQLLLMIGLVALVDGLAMATWFLAGLRTQGSRVQLLFTIVWTLVTFAVVVVSIRKIRGAGSR